MVEGLSYGSVGLESVVDEVFLIWFYVYLDSLSYWDGF